MERTKWSDFQIRLLSGLILLVAQIFFILAGQKTIIAELFVIEAVAFYEFVNVKLPGCNTQLVKKQSKLFLQIYPYLIFLLTNLYLSTDRIFNYFQIECPYKEYNSLIFFILLSIIAQFFVFSINVKIDKFIFAKLALTIVGIIIIVIPFHVFFTVVDKSVFWFTNTVSLVCFNDTFAYLVGRSFGKHPLIDVSPKKTVEGFFGGLIATVLASYLIPLMFQKWEFLIARESTIFNIRGNYSTPAEFVKIRYNFLGFSFLVLPAQVLNLGIALFTSLLAPVGGFLASSFKRAISIKDFSNMIPGHGGLIDRIDCQIVNGLFSALLLNALLQE